MENRIIYKKEDVSFQKQLNQKVQFYFEKNNISPFGNKFLYFKAAIFGLSYLAISIALLYCESLTQLYICYALLGPLTIFTALNIGHEAAHGIFSKNKKVNQFFTYTFDLLGANGQVWKYKHVDSHHPLTNIHQVDHELEAPPLLRVFPQDRIRKMHKYQHLYMPFVYSLYTLVWFCYRDYKDFFNPRIQNGIKFKTKDRIRFFVGKFFFFSRMIGLPFLLLPFTLPQIILGFLLFNICASIIATFALISTHMGEHNAFPTPDDRGRMPSSWIRHQIMTTSNFSTENKFITALYGGFNHHLTHHLFPRISHIHYPMITKVIKEHSEKFKIDLIPEMSLGRSMYSHFSLLRQRGAQGLSLEHMEL